MVVNDGHFDVLTMVVKPIKVAKLTLMIMVSYQQLGMHIQVWMVKYR